MATRCNRGQPRTSCPEKLPDDAWIATVPGQASGDRSLRGMSGYLLCQGRDAGLQLLLGAVYDDIGEVPAAITSHRRLLITRRAERPWWFAPIALNVQIGHPHTGLEAAVSEHKVLPNAERPPGKLADSAPEPATGTKPTGMEPAAAQLMGECLRLGIGVYLIVLGSRCWLQFRGPGLLRRALSVGIQASRLPWASLA